MTSVISIVKVQTRNGGDRFVNLAHLTNAGCCIDESCNSISAGKGIRLQLVDGDNVQVFGQSAELLRSHLESMAIDLTGAPQDRNSALEEC